MGNQLFGIAATIGLSLRHGYTPRFPADWKYRDVFNIPAEWFGEIAPEYRNIKEQCYKHDFALERYIQTYARTLVTPGFLECDYLQTKAVIGATWLSWCKCFPGSLRRCLRST